jgi:hypothetical protein
MTLSPEIIKKIFDDDVTAIAAELQIEVPQAVYRYAPYVCWSCKEKMLVYAWPPNREHFPQEEPPHGKPPSIKWVKTRTAETSYWGNVCPHCNNVQGGWFVHIEPDSPLFGLGEIEDSPENFEIDLQKIADYYVTQLREV